MTLIRFIDAELVLLIVAPAPVVFDGTSHLDMQKF